MNDRDDPWEESKAVKPSRSLRLRRAPRRSRLRAGLLIVDRLLERVDLEVGRPGTPHLPFRIRRRRLGPLGLEPGPISGTYFISLDRVRTFSGFSYLSQGWHPYRAALAELLEQPDLRYKGSKLESFYERFQPRTVAEVLRGPGAMGPPPLQELPAWLMAQIWTIGTKRKTSRPGLAGRAQGRVKRVPNSEHVGPITSAYGDAKIEKLRRTFASIAAEGYRPLEVSGGIIEGIFLTSGNDYVFLPTEGQHRLAALDRLEIRRILVRIRAGGPTVSLQSLPLWCRSRGGPFPEATADELFRFFFTERGDRQTRLWSLDEALQ